MKRSEMLGNLDQEPSLEELLSLQRWVNCAIARKAALGRSHPEPPTGMRVDTGPLFHFSSTSPVETPRPKRRVPNHRKSATLQEVMRGHSDNDGADAIDVARRIF